MQIPVQYGGAVVNPGDVVFGDADVWWYCRRLRRSTSRAAEKLTENEKIRAERIEKEGYRFLRRDDFDVEKFFEFDKSGLFNEIKKRYSV